MSKYENKPGWGALFHNDKKPEGSKQPDYRGSLKLLSGEEIELAIWIKLDRNNKKFLSIGQSKPYDKKDKPKEIDGEIDEMGF